MEEHKKKLPRKSVIIFSAIFIVLIILIAVFGRFLPQKPEPIQQSAPTPVSSTDLNKEYTSALFSFHYPSSWKPQLFNIAGGGNGVTIRPVNAKGTDYFPRFHIESSPVSEEASMENRIELLSWMRFERSNVTILGNAAVKLSGTVPFFKDDKPIDPPVHKTYLFFEKAGYLYIVTYAYYDKVNAGNEEFFTNILNTLQIQEGAI